MTSLYSCKSQINGSGNLTYRITKFDDDMNVESSYTCTETKCECPAGIRPSCRHRDMLPKFIARDAVNSMWLYHFDRDGWISSDVHLEGGLASAEPSVSPDPGTQLPIAGERPTAMDLPAMPDIVLSDGTMIDFKLSGERPVETRRATNPALIRRF